MAPVLVNFTSIIRTVIRLVPANCQVYLKRYLDVGRKPVPYDEETINWRLREVRHDFFRLKAAIVFSVDKRSDH